MAMFSAHVLHAGAGTMALFILADGTVVMYGCSLTAHNQTDVLSYLRHVVPLQGLDLFIHPGQPCAQVTGLRTLREHFPIWEVWEPETLEIHGRDQSLADYLAVRRAAHRILKLRTGIRDFGSSRLRVLRQCRPDGPATDCGSSPVIRVELLGGTTGRLLHSLLVAGSSAPSHWHERILPANMPRDLQSTVLLASRSENGSQPSGGIFDSVVEAAYLKAISPVATVLSNRGRKLSGGENDAIRLFRRHSTAANSRFRVLQTRLLGHLVLKFSTESGFTFTSVPSSPSLAQQPS